jgi:hypothetical protein
VALSKEAQALLDALKASPEREEVLRLLCADLYPLQPKEEKRGKQPDDPLQDILDAYEIYERYKATGLSSRKASEQLAAEFRKRPSTLRHEIARVKKWLRQGGKKLSRRQQVFWAASGRSQSVSLPSGDIIWIAPTDGTVGR